MQRPAVVFAFLLCATAAVASDLPSSPPPMVAPTYDPILVAKEPVAVDPTWGVHVFAGASAGHTRLIELVPMPWRGEYADNYLVAAAVSRRFARNGNFIWEGEVGAGYRFKEVNAPEAWIALYLRYDGFPWNDFIYTTVAINTGLSYVEKLSFIEADAPQTSKVLHYFGPEITIARPDYRNLELVMRWHHRSGVFGLFNGVKGGTNVVTGGVRYRW